MFKITHGRGIHLTFENGYTVSAQWGYDNFCQKQSEKCLSTVGAPGSPGSERFVAEYQSNDCEIAIWRKTETGDIWVTYDVIDMLDIEVFRDCNHKYPAIGYVTADQFAKIVSCVANLV